MVAGARALGLEAFCSAIIANLLPLSTVVNISAWRAEQMSAGYKGEVGFCTVSLLKFLEIQSKLVRIEAVWREGRAHSKGCHKTFSEVWQQVPPLDLRPSSECIYSLKRRNKHPKMCLVLTAGVIYSLQTLFFSQWSDCRLEHSIAHRFLFSFPAIAPHKKHLKSGCSQSFPSRPYGQYFCMHCDYYLTPMHFWFFFLNQLPIFKIGF